MLTIVSAFWSGLTAPRSCSPKTQSRADKKMRDKMTEEQLDRMLAETCDASDPICNY